LRGQPLPLVELDAGEYLLEALMKLGFCSQAPMGGALPCGYGEVYDFARATSRVDEGWEIETLVDMSSAYCRGLQRGKNPFAKSPMQIFDAKS
jgi:hypothetical protein